MAFVLKDRVRETTTVTGTGPATLLGPAGGFQSFGGVMSVGDTCWYAIIHAGTAWESGIGTYSSSNVLTRTTVLESSNSGAAVSFAAGSKDVYIGLPASQAVTPDNRQNDALNWIYSSKLYGDYRRGVNLFATGLKAATDALRGINTGLSSNFDASNAAASGYVLPTMTSPTLISWTSPTNIGDMTAGGGLAGAFDGVTNQVNSAGARKAGSNPAFIGRFQSGAPKTVTRVTIFAPNNSNINGNNVASAAGNIKIYGKVTGQSTTNTDGVLLYSGTFTDGSIGGGNIIDITSGITAQASESVFVRIDFGANTTYDVNVAEVQFYEGGGVSSNMTLTTEMQTSDFSVSNGRVVLEFNNTATPTLNTDLTVEVTCNGGTNWTSAALAQVTANGQASRKVAETVDQVTTAGTSFAARVKTLNNKNVPIYGISVVVH